MMISIAMTTYNGQKFIREQIDSILRQTIQDFELVVCDDASTDDTWQILKEYETKENRISCYRNEQNVGFVKNFERAMSLCKGNYIALSDQDDIWTENHLQVLLENIGNNVVCCGDSILMENNLLTDRLSVRCGGNILKLDTPEKKIKRILYHGNVYQGASMLIKSSHIKQILPIPTKFHDIWIALYGCTHDGLVYVDEIISHYRQHATNVTSTKKQTLLRDLTHLSLKKYKNTVHLFYVEALLERFPNMDEAHKKTLLEVQWWFHNAPKRWWRFKNIPFWIKTYSYRFPGQSRILLVPKLIRFLFL